MGVIGLYICFLLLIIIVLINRLSSSKSVVNEAVLDQSRHVVDNENYRKSIEKIVGLIVFASLLLGVCVSIILLGSLSAQHNASSATTGFSPLWTASGFALITISYGLFNYFKLKRQISTN